MSERDRAVLFHRSFDRFAGHHLKVWHYFNYVLDEPGYSPRLMLTEESLWDETNPWFAVPRPRDARQPAAPRGHLLLLRPRLEPRCTATSAPIRPCR